MEKIKKLCSESFFVSLFNYAMFEFFPFIKNMFYQSFFYSIWKSFDKLIINSKPVRLLFDFDYISFVWKKSFFYKSLFFYVIKFFDFLSDKGFKIKIHHICIIVFYIICFPQNTLSIFSALVLGIILFYIVSSVIKTKEDLKELFSFLYSSAIILCLYGFNIKSSLIGELLIMIFPFVFIYSIEFNKGLRKYFYLSFIFTAYINIIPAMQSKAVIIGFLAEVIVLIITDIKYFPLVLLLSPLGITAFLNNIKNTWYAAANYGNFLNNIIILSHKLWNNGFGISRRKFMDLYYIKDVGIIADAGAVIMVFFFIYILRIARSTLTSLFSADKEFKRIFAAGLSFLVGVSSSSLVNATIFSSGTMLVYWVILGVLRAVRIMNFKTASLDKIRGM